MMLKPLIVATALLSASAVIAADSSISAPFKIYTVSNVERVISNSPECRPTYNALKTLTKKDVRLKFTRTGKSGNFVMTDLDNVLKNLTFTILKEESKPHKINRIGTGSFELNQEKIDYVIQVGVHLNETMTPYEYPMILSANKHFCYYSAILKPSDDTTARFKNNIQKGRVKNGADLTQ